MPGYDRTLAPLFSIKELSEILSVNPHFHIGRARAADRCIAVLRSAAVIPSIPVIALFQNAAAVRHIKAVSTLLEDISFFAWLKIFVA